MPSLCALARIDEAVLDPRAVEEAVWSPSDGAVVTFSGVVRNHDSGREVLEIEYSAHPTAPETLARLCDLVAHEHTSPKTEDGEPVDPMRSVRVGVAHRVGTLAVGEVAVVVVAVAPHRDAAFAACEDLIHRIKHGVPVWKRQRFTDGVSEWVGINEC
ncbi:molybdenum cofactor biosynthesis protein MoaE [Dietzia sp. 179-F 9C3 NHS]|uniref:molybdenum cofactor biosynthesis protein MoaE n=1 Tax=Dietzia sp. 179-F 9C3 NHS TaxID=3374295 RepID=UPI0038796342